MYAELTRICSVCGIQKITSTKKNWYNGPTCGACYQKKYKKDFPDRVRDAKLKCNYGVSLEQYNEMLRAQHGRCSICKATENKLKNGIVQHFVVDHCHKSGKPRGLLCHTCNMRVGIYENWAPQVMEYLKKCQN